LNDKLRNCRFRVGNIPDVAFGPLPWQDIHMKVAIEFGAHRDEYVADAIWIVDTVENRAWFETLAGRIDANSAVFQEVSDPLMIVSHVFEHHPNWTEIDVNGTPLTPAIEQGVKPEALAQSLSDGRFRLIRIA
jgi:hypothetical protein